MSVHLGSESLCVLIMADGAHGPLGVQQDAVAVVGAVAAVGGVAVLGVVAVAVLASLLEFAPVFGAAQLPPGGAVELHAPAVRLLLEVPDRELAPQGVAASMVAAESMGLARPYAALYSRAPCSSFLIAWPARRRRRKNWPAARWPQSADGLGWRRRAAPDCLVQPAHAAAAPMCARCGVHAPQPTPVHSVRLEPRRPRRCS